MVASTALDEFQVSALAMRQDSGDVSVACRLSDTEFRQREATLRTQFRSAVVTSQELPDGFAFRIPGDKESVAAVAQLIAAERECSPFLIFDLAGPAQSRASGSLPDWPLGTKEFLRKVFCKSGNARTR